MSPPFVPSTQWCSLFDVSDVANQAPRWIRVEDAEATYHDWYGNDPAIVSFETDILASRGGRVLVVDSQWQDGSDACEFIYSGDARWLLLGCMTYGSGPEDRWLHIGETLDLQPRG